MNRNKNQAAIGSNAAVSAMAAEVEEQTGQRNQCWTEAGGTDSITKQRKEKKRRDVPDATVVQAVVVAAAAAAC